MVSNIYLLLGLAEDAPWSEVSRAYARLMESLNSEESDLGRSAVMERLQSAKERLSESFEHVKNPDIRSGYQHQPQGSGFCRPKIGQLLVAAGLMSMEELDSALEIQQNTRNQHIALGELLVAAGYITANQLDYYLRQQDLFQLPPDHPQRWGQRLVELGMVNEDQLKVALIEQKTTGCTLRKALMNRGWLSEEELDRIF